MKNKLNKPNNIWNQEKLKDIGKKFCQMLVLLKNTSELMMKL